MKLIKALETIIKLKSIGVSYSHNLSVLEEIIESKYFDRGMDVPSFWLHVHSIDSLQKAIDILEKSQINFWISNFSHGKNYDFRLCFDNNVNYWPDDTKKILKKIKKG